MGEGGVRTEQERIETLGFLHNAVELHKLIERLLLNETVRIQDRFNFFTKRFDIFRHNAEVIYQLAWSSSTGMNCCERDLEDRIAVSIPSNQETETANPVKHHHRRNRRYQNCVYL